MACQNGAIVIDQDGIGKPELAHAVSKLVELLFGVGTRILRPGAQGCNRYIMDDQFCHYLPS